jgi:hypothetical protein
MSTQARPTGVTIIAILAFIGGIFAIVAGLGSTVLGGILEVRSRRVARLLVGYSAA